jgi:hypothetical protein
LLSLRATHSDTQWPSRLARSKTIGASPANGESPNAGLLGTALGLRL